MNAHSVAFGAIAGATVTLGLMGAGADRALVAVILGVAGAGGCAALVGKGPWRWALVLGLASFGLSGLASHHSWRSVPVIEAKEHSGWVLLATDPQPNGLGVRATVIAGGQRFELQAFGATVAGVQRGGAGDWLLVEGKQSPIDQPWLKWRHIVGRLSARAVLDHRPGSPVSRLANGIRDRLEQGASPLSRSDRSLLTGMVLGDDRDQPAVIADDFRAAGLGHLLVVSGQNVAFVLALAGPLTARLRPGARLLVILILLFLILVVTRFEPSVLRATAMAGFATARLVLGSPSDGRTALSWSVAALVIIDPFLIHQLAFQLSALATAGIVWIGPFMQSRLRGPLAFRQALAMTMGAQFAVSPLLVTTFDSIPLASVPANLLAGPLSGPVMMWGCTAGIAAGFFGGGVATTLHLPTRAMLWMVRLVASSAAAAPPLMIETPGLVVAVMALVALVVGRQRLAAVLAAAVVAIAVLSLPGHPAGWVSPSSGIEVWQSDNLTVVVIDSPRRERDVLENLRVGGFGRPDLVVTVKGGRSDAYAVLALADRYGPLVVLAPPLHRVPGAKTVVEEVTVEVKGERVEVTNVDGQLRVTNPGGGK